MARFEETQDLRGVNLDIGEQRARMGLAQRLEQFASSARAKGSEMGQKMGGFIDMAQDIQKKAAEKDVRENFRVERDENGDIIAPKQEGTSVYAKTRNMLQMEAYKATLARDTEKDIRALEAKSQGNLLSLNDNLEAYRAGMLKSIDPSVANEWMTAVDELAHAARLRVQDRQIGADITEAQTDLRLTLNDARDKVSQLIANGGTEAEIDLALITVLETEQALYPTLSVEEQAQFEVEREAYAKLATNERYMADVVDIYKAEGYDAAIARLDKLGNKVPQDYNEEEYYDMLQGVKARLDRDESLKRAGRAGKDYQLDIDLKQLEQKIVEDPANVNMSEKARLEARVALSGDPRYAERIRMANKKIKYLTYSDEQLEMMDADLEKRNLGLDQQALREIRTKRKEMFQANAIGAMRRLGFDDKVPPPEDYSERMRYFKRVSEFSGVPVGAMKYFSPEEESALASMIESGSDAELQSAMNLVRGIPVEMISGAAGQLSDNGAGWLVQTAFATERARTLVLAGRKLTTGKDAPFEPLKIDKLNEDDFINKVTEYYGDTLNGVEQDMRSIIDAAKLAYIPMHQQSTYSWSNFRDSLDMFGPVRDINGHKTILPVNTTESDFRAFVRSITSEDVKQYGSPLPPKRVLNAIQNGRLKAIGENQYQIIYDNAYVPGPTGAPLVINFSRDIASREVTQQERRLTR